MQCPNCGKESPEGSVFCQECGSGLDGRPNGWVPPRPTGPLPYAPPPNPPVAFPYAQTSPYSYPPVDLKNSGIAMIIGIMLPGFGHVYCEKVLQGLLIFTTFVVIAIIAVAVGVLTFGLGSLPIVLLLLTVEILQLLNVKKKAEEYNRVVRETGRPPW